MRSLIFAAILIVPTVALAEPGPLHSACHADVQALCGSVQPGGGRIRDCMREHRTQLSAACKVAIADRMLERQAHRGMAPTTSTSVKSVLQPDGK